MKKLSLLVILSAISVATHAESAPAVDRGVETVEASLPVEAPFNV